MSINMVRLLLWAFMLLVSIGSVFMCMGSSSNREILLKIRQSDETYMLQDVFLNKCINEIDEEQYSMMNAYKNLWSENAFEVVKELFEINIQELLNLHNFIDCIKILAEHEAKKFFCPKFAEVFERFDFIFPYVVEDYEICIAHKNKKLETPIKFKKPKLGLISE